MADQPDVVGAILGAAATVGVGVLTLIGVRVASKPAQKQADVADQELVKDGLKDLLEATRAALADTRTALEDTRAELTASRKQNVDFQRLIEEGQARGQARDSELHQLRAMIEGLERLLRRNNIPVPARKVYAPQEAETAMVTLRQDAAPSDD
ncbi:hypothetical protein UFOVP1324_57 [uncultured Caudovirales phage]|uniref:Uncharacterized protein n=1 Tax=uncultured Caudovirales phage TaxID=2100421 RepID=A0A6J5RMY0_9CAUD|nr:hypothetical protein UFOVP1324_57 [uncultured Caudovirales phage]